MSDAQYESRSEQWQSWDQVPLVLTLQQVANLLQLHPSTVKRWASTGRLPAVKVGRDYRFRRDVIEKLTLGLLPQFLGWEDEPDQDEGDA